MCLSLGLQILAAVLGLALLLELMSLCAWVTLAAARCSGVCLEIWWGLDCCALANEVAGSERAAPPWAPSCTTLSWVYSAVTGFSAECFLSGSDLIPRSTSCIQGVCFINTCDGLNYWFVRFIILLFWCFPNFVASIFACVRCFQLYVFMRLKVLPYGYLTSAQIDCMLSSFI